MRKHKRPVDRGPSGFQRRLSILPSLFTIGNLFCGYFSVISTLKGNYDEAAMAIGVGWVFDGLDGRIARLTKTSSEFGVQLDSLADLLTFGAAPAVLAYRWGLNSIAGVATDVRHLLWLASFAFLTSGALRLARFNVQSQKAVEPGSKRHFTGLPIPAGASLVAAIVHFHQTPILSVGSTLLWAVLILLTAVLMVSTIRYESFKDWNFARHRTRALLGASMLLGLVFFYSQEVLLVIAAVYVASGPVAKLSEIVRRVLNERAATHPAPGNVKS